MPKLREKQSETDFCKKKKINHGFKKPLLVSSIILRTSCCNDGPVEFIVDTRTNNNKIG